MAIAWYSLDAAKVAAALARHRGPLFVLLPALIALVTPATAWGDIFKWTDEQGRINISNVPPPSSGKAKNIVVALKETRPASTPQHVATPTEQALLARIEVLERQLQARQYASQAPPAPAPAPYAVYYPPPPPPSSYYGGGYAGSYPGYYPSYTYPAAVSYVVYPARTYLAQPVFVAPRGGFSHHGGGARRGRR